VTEYTRVWGGGKDIAAPLTPCEGEKIGPTCGEKKRRKDILTK